MHEAGDSTPSVFALVDRILPVALIAGTCAVESISFGFAFVGRGETVQTPATCCSEGGSSIEPSIVVFDEALHTSLIAKAAANGVYIMCLLSCSRGHRTSRCFGSEKMLRLGHILGVAIYVSLPWHPAASEAAACPDAVCKETQAVFDEVDSADEEALRLELLQVSTKLERRGGEQHAQLTAVQNVPGTDRQSVFGSLLAANAGTAIFCAGRSAATCGCLFHFIVPSPSRRRASKNRRSSSGRGTARTSAQHLRPIRKY